MPGFLREGCYDLTGGALGFLLLECTTVAS